EFAFDLEEVLLAVRDDADEGLEEDERDEEAWPPFCAVSVTGSSRATAMNATPMRLCIISFLLENSSRAALWSFQKSEARERLPQSFSHAECNFRRDSILHSCAQWLSTCRPGKMRHFVSSWPCSSETLNVRDCTVG